MSEEYELVRVLRRLPVPDKHIRAALRLELGLDEDQIDRAMGDQTPSPTDVHGAVIDLAGGEVRDGEPSMQPTSGRPRLWAWRSQLRSSSVG